MVTRILQILKEENLTASQFADVIDVQRSSMSHILSGRNNPSLDFVHKILKAFPKINTDWLMFGTGTMYNQKDDVAPNLNANDHVSASIESPNTQVKSSSTMETLDLFGDFTPQPTKNEPVIAINPVVADPTPLQNEVKKEAVALSDIKNTEAESYIQKQPEITRSESDISSLPKETPEISHSREVVKNASLEDKEIDRIVIFYSDNTFSMYKPEKR